MGQWYCFECNERMIEDDVWMTYMDITRALPGLKCPKCGTGYLTEETVVGTINPGEELLEDKFGID